MRLSLIEHDVVDSTSERAFAALAAGQARHGDTFVAREQTAGRGRRGASWSSARDEGLYLSVVLLPESPAHPAALTMASGLAVLDAVTGLGLLGARLKWPNDVVVGAEAAKLAGVLVETRGLDAARPHYVVGIGVNVGQRSFPAELTAQRPVTSLLQRSLDCSVLQARAALLETLAPRLEQALRRDDALCADFIAASQLSEREVLVECGEEHFSGHLFALTWAGLVLREPSGRERRCALEHVRAVRES